MCTEMAMMQPASSVVGVHWNIHTTSSTQHTCTKKRYGLLCFRGIAKYTANVTLCSVQTLTHIQCRKSICPWSIRLCWWRIMYTLYVRIYDATFLEMVFIDIHREWSLLPWNYQTYWNWRKKNFFSIGKQKLWDDKRKFSYRSKIFRTKKIQKISMKRTLPFIRSQDVEATTTKKNLQFVKWGEKKSIEKFCYPKNFPS